MDNSTPSGNPSKTEASSDETTETLLGNAPLRKGYEEYEESGPDYENPGYYGPGDENPEYEEEVEGTPGPAIHTLPSSDPLFLPESSLAERLGGLLGSEKNELGDLLATMNAEPEQSLSLVSTEASSAAPELASLFQSGMEESHHLNTGLAPEQHSSSAELLADASTSAIDGDVLNLYLQGGII